MGGLPAERAVKRGRERLLGALPLLAGLAVLLVVMGRTWLMKDHYSGGVFTYALDDAYIHMALAKNLALHGVFGATPFEFTSASSSPLWTLLLALGFKLFGVRDTLPLVLTTLASVGLLVTVEHVLRHFRVGTLARAITLPWVAGAAPLVAIIFGGMEHPLQLLIDVAFVYLAVRVAHRSELRWDALAFGTLALAAAACAVRYEGALLVALVSLLLATRGRWGLAVAVAAAGAAPLVAWGLVSVANGGFFLPNSVLVKSSDSLLQLAISGGMSAYVGRIRDTLTTAYPVYALLAASASLLVLQIRRGASGWDPAVLFAGLAIAVSVTHLFVGQVGWFFRYEDYMIVLLAVGIVAQLAQVLRGTRARLSVVTVVVGVLVVAAAVSGVTRGVLALRSTPRAMENIYEQMYQTAHFLKENPQYDSVAIGDLGAVSYYNDGLRILDLEGLAEQGVALESLGRQNATEADIAALAAQDGCDIAIVFPEYFDLPDEWVEVGRWRISNNLVAYSDTVAFLAIPPTDPRDLAEDLRRYSVTKLPPTVSAEGVSLPDE